MGIRVGKGKLRVGGCLPSPTPKSAPAWGYFFHHAGEAANIHCKTQKCDYLHNMIVPVFILRHNFDR